MQVVERGVERTDSVPRPVVFDGVCREHRETEQMQRIVEDTSGFISLLTNGNGACGLHAAFGNLGSGVEFFCDGGRLKASDALRRFHESRAHGYFLRGKVLTAIWCELTKPVIMHQLGRTNAPPPHAMEFWSKLPQALRMRCHAHVLAVEHAVERNQALRAERGTLSRRLCTLEAADFLDALFAKLKQEYGNIGKFDVDGKLDFLVDSRTANDKYRVAFFLPTHDAAQGVAEDTRTCKYIP
jgi:hypothetical protein